MILDPARQRLERTRQRWALRMSSDLAVLQAAARHGDGHLREAAVRRLGELPSIDALPALIERCNDWVAPVRHAAQVALYRLLRAEHAAALVIALPRLQHLRRCRRADHDALVTAVEQLLQRCPAALHAGLYAADARVARACFLLSWQTAPTLALIACGLRSRDCVIADRAAGALRTLEATHRPPLLALARRAPLMPVRREALQLALQDADDATATTLALAALLDSAPALRRMALRWLCAHGQQAAARASLRNALAGPRRIRAIGLLAELGEAADAHRIEGLLTAAEPALRAACLGALLRLLPARSDDWIAAAFADPAASVVRRVRTAPRLYEYDAATLLHLLAGAAAPAAALAVLETVGRRLDKWERLRLILALPATVQVRSLSDWLARYNRSFATPSAAQRLALQHALSAPALAACPARLRCELDFTLAAHALGIHGIE